MQRSGNDQVRAAVAFAGLVAGYNCVLTSVTIAHLEKYTAAGHMLTSRRHHLHTQHLSCKAATLQFIRGIDEPSVPDVKLTRSKDGSSGTATFVFDAPSVFESSEELGDITGLFMIDDEGDFSTVDVQAKFVNGKPDRIEARYVMRSAFEWDRFMRFMERYAEKQGLGFQKVTHPVIIKIDSKDMFM